MSGRRRHAAGAGDGGYTLVELLAVLTIMGSVALVAAALVPATWREAEAVAAHQQQSQELMLTVARLRADVARAGSARVEGDSLVLGGDSLALGGDVEVRWSSGDDVVRSAPGSRRSVPLAATYRVEARPRGAIVAWSLAGAGGVVEGRSLVGSDGWGRP